MIPPKAVMLQELERVIPRAAAFQAIEVAMERADGRDDAFRSELTRALGRHMADEDVEDVLHNLGYEDHLLPGLPH